jgi:NAD(P)-dependent dehydrogenase (short-subunit alcohol dehydrogenase family)
VAVVTGGASGIGRAVAGRLSAGGVRVIVVDRDPTGAAAAAAHIEAQHGAADSRGLDVLDRDGIDDFWQWVAGEYARCDILVNSAGVAWLRPFSDLTVAEWDTTFGVNVTGAMLMAQGASHMMVQKRWGRIVNVTSVSGLRASVGRTAYGSSKAALTGLTRQLAIELAEDGVTVNAVAPGPVSTPLAESTHSKATRDAYHRVIPMRRYATSEEVAAAVRFFASEEAGYITGHTIPVDGGYMAAGILDA